VTTDVTVDTVVAPAPDVHVVTLDDEKVVFVPGPATLHHLDAIGALVWECLTPPAPASGSCRSW
jgi:hypothetical protein